MLHYGHVFNFNPWTLRAVAGLAGLEEAAETAARSAGTTGAFFRRGVVLPESAALNPENGERVRELIRRHYAGTFRRRKAVKLLSKLAARVEETMTGLTIGSPQSIGSKVARARLAPEEMAADEAGTGR